MIIASFYYSVFSADGVHKAIGHFRIQFSTEESHWEPQKTIE